MMKALVLLSVASASSAVDLIGFSFGPGPINNFTEVSPPTSWNPKPSSHATFVRECSTIDCGPGEGAIWHGILDGEVKVEWNGDASSGMSNGWPGVVRATGNGDYNDASSALTRALPVVSGSPSGFLVLVLRTTWWKDQYTGFHVSLGTTEHWNTTDKACGSELGPNQQRGCYKASFGTPVGIVDTPVRIPFTDFSQYWQYGGPYTGVTPPNRTCRQDKTACITAQALARIKSIDFWAEGVAGEVHLEVVSVSAQPGPAQA